MLRLKNFAIPSLAVLLLGALWLGFTWYESLDPQGGQNAWCDSVRLATIRSKSGMVASGHNTVCSGFGGNSAVYIHVHKEGEAENRNSMVFRYFEVDRSSEPKLEWVTDQSLVISVDKVSQVTKQLPSLSGINIKYHVGTEEYPRP